MAAWFHDLGLFMFAVLAHWQALATGGFVTAMVSVYERKKNTQLSWQSYAFILSAFGFYAIFAAWQDEHRNTTSVIYEKSTYAAQSIGCLADLKASQGSLRDKEILADSFQKAFTSMQVPQAQQAANIASCINNLAKMNPRIHEEINVVPITVAITDQNGKYVGMFAPRKFYRTLLLITTNESENQFHGYLRCDKDFTIDGNPQLPKTSQVIMYGGSVPRKISDHEYEISVSIQGTSWAPARPAYVFVQSIDEMLGNCFFTPQQ